jgi:hypothetical protein
MLRRTASLDAHDVLPFGRSVTRSAYCGTPIPDRFEAGVVEAAVTGGLRPNARGNAEAPQSRVVTDGAGVRAVQLVRQIRR